MAVSILFCVVLVYLSPTLAVASSMDGVTFDAEKEYNCLLNRFDDRLNKIQAKIVKLKEETDSDTLTTSITTQDTKPYAFSAYRSPYDTGPRSSGNLTFTKVISNVGGVYDTSTGVFSSPVNGLYVFHFQANTYQYSKHCTLSLVRNNATIVSAYSNDKDGMSTFGNTAIVELREKDAVYVAITSPVVAS